MTSLTERAVASPDLAAPGGAVQVFPVRHGERPLGAYVASHGTATFVPAIDVTRLAAYGLAAVVLTATVSAAAVRCRRPPAIGTVTMGPGGWISLKRTGSPPLRSGQPRPWWARLLRARRLVAQP